MSSEATAVKYVQAFERTAADTPLLGRVYSRLFYRGMISRECSLACIRAGDRVVQIGCGPFPMTALELARRGCEVTAVDSDERALERAKRVVARMAQAGGSETQAAARIRFACRDARDFHYGGFRAVIIALHVQPKRAVLARVSETGDEATRVVYRNPRSLLRAAYRVVRPSEGGCPDCATCRSASFGKSLVMFETGDGRHDSEIRDTSAVRDTSGSHALSRSRSTSRPPTSLPREAAGYRETGHRERRHREIHPPEPRPATATGSAGCEACRLECSPCTLCELSPRQCVRITSAPQIPSLAALGVRPGKACRFVARQPFGGPVICSVGGRQVAIERDIARRIEVERDYLDPPRSATNGTVAEATGEPLTRR